MAGYGTFRYGQAKYGATSNLSLGWGFLVDWDNDGIYENNEAGYMVDLSWQRGRSYYVNSDGTGFEPVSVGSINAVFANENRRFDPYNTDGPLYEYLYPGRNFKLIVKYYGIIYNIAVGKISNITPISGNLNMVRIDCVDGIQWLLDEDITISVSEDITSDDAITAALTGASYPSLWGTNIESSTDVIPYWWVDGQRAHAAIEELSQSGLGTFFIANDGKATYYPRHHNEDSVLALTETDILKQIGLPQPWEVVRNINKIIANPRVEQAQTDLWTLQDTPSIAAGETIELFAQYVDSNSGPTPALTVINPVINTDYTANTSDDGSGTDITASIVITTTVWSQTAKLSIKNNSIFSGYITKLKIRGNAITVPNKFSIMDEDTASITKYGKRRFTLESTWLQNVNTAVSIMDFLKIFLVSPRLFPTIIIQSRPDVQFIPDLFDKISLTVNTLGINENFQVGSIGGRWMSDNGQAVETTLGLEPIFSQVVGDYWTFTTLIGVSSYFGF